MSGLPVEERSSSKSPRRKRSAVVLLSFGLVLLMTQTGKGQPPDALKFFKNYFVTGNYFVYGIPLKGTGINGLATGTINVPANSVPPGGQAIAAHSVLVVGRHAGQSAGRPCRCEVQGERHQRDRAKHSSPPAHHHVGLKAAARATLRARKLTFFTMQTYSNSSSRTATGNLWSTPAHQVILPDSGGGNVTPFTLGASLLVVYRTATDPLRSIVIYDGGFTMDQGTDSVNQTIKGFYQAATQSPAAQLSLIIGDGQPNFPERLRFNNQVIPNSQIGVTAGTLGQSDIQRLIVHGRRRQLCDVHVGPRGYTVPIVLLEAC